MRERGKKVNILILSTRIPYPLTAGFRIRIYNTAKYLKSAGHTMGLIQLSSSKLSKHDEEHLREVFDSIIIIKISKIESIKNLFTCIFRRQIPFQVALYQNKDM